MEPDLPTYQTKQPEPLGINILERLGELTVGVGIGLYYAQFQPKEIVTYVLFMGIAGVLLGTMFIREFVTSGC